MSTTIDERIVEMRFDNKQFEANVATSMSTLEKLKQKLNLTGASKGLEEVNDAARKVDMTGLGNSVETVKAKFSALQIVGITALTNITNQAVNAAKRIVSSLTVAPVSDGFKEYEMVLNAVQTTMVATGKTAEEVQKELQKLDEYADKTVYSTSDMLNNLPKFTNAGVELEVATKAMIGIANATAHAGAGAQQASIAYYNLGQAIGTGYLSRMDYNSINNAGIATIRWKEEMVNAAIAAGTLTKAGDDLYKAGGKTFSLQQLFIDGLQHQWATKDVLIEVFSKYGDEFNDLGKEAWDSAQDIKTYTQMMESLKATAGTGWKETWQLIIGDLKEAKEFWTGLSNFISGIITGMNDFRNRVLQIALDFSAPWNAMFEKLKNAGLIFDKLNDKINGKLKNAIHSLEDYQKIVTDVWIGYYNHNGDNPDRRDLIKEAGFDARVVQDLVNKGYLYKLTMEDVVASHEKFGLTMEMSTEQTQKAIEATGTYEATLASLTDDQLRAVGLTEEEIELFRALAEEASRTNTTIWKLTKDMSERDGRERLIESFKNIGDVFIGTAKAAKTAWIEIVNPPGVAELGIKLFGIISAFEKFTEKLRLTDKTTGDLNDNGKKLQRTFKGIFAIIDIISTILGGTFKIVFNVISQVLGYFHLNILDVTAAIGDVLVKFHEWFESVTDISGVIEAIAPIVKQAADAVAAWFDAFKESEGVKAAGKYLNDLWEGIQKWWTNLRSVDDLPKTIAEGIVNAFSSIPTVISTIFSNLWAGLTGSFSDANGFNPVGGFLDGIVNGFKIAGQTIVELGKILLEKLNGFLSAHGFKEISEESIAGLVNGFKDGATKAWDAAVNMIGTLVQKVRDFLGIESPSKVFIAIGGFMIAGLIAGLQNGIPDSLGVIKDIFQPMLDWIKTLDFGSILAGVLGMGTIQTTYKAVNALSSPVEGLGEIFEGTGKVLDKTAKPIAKVIKNTAKVVKSFSKVLNAVAFDIKAEGIKTLGITLLMLVGAIAVLTFLDPAELWNAVGIVAALAAILIGLAFAIDKLNSASVSASIKDGINISGLTTSLMGIGVGILLMALTIKMLGSLDPEQATQGFLAMAGIIVAIGAVVIAFGTFVKGKSAQNIDKFGKTMTKMAVALLIMAVVVKMLGSMDTGVLIQGSVALAIFAGIVVGLIAASRLLTDNKHVSKLGAMIQKIAIAIAIMAIVAKMLGGMDPSELNQGATAIIAFSGIIVGLIAATKLITKNKNIDKIGNTILAISGAIAIMALTAKVLGGMDPLKLLQGTLAIAAFGGIIVGLVAATQFITGSKNIDKIGGALLKIAAVIAIMGVVTLMLGLMEPAKLIQGTIAIAAFGGIIVGLIAATKLLTGTKNIDKIGNTLLAITGAIAIMAGIAVLLGLVPTENLIKGTVVMILLGGLAAGLIAVTKLAKKCLGNIIALTVMIAVLAGAVYLISTIPAASAITSAAVLGGLMIILTGVLWAVSKIGKTSKDALKGIVLLTAMVVPLMALVGVLALMSGVSNAVASTLILSGLILAMTGVLAILIPVGKRAADAIMGVIALTTMAVPLLALVGILALMSGVNNAVTNAIALAALAAVLTALLIPLTVIGSIAMSGAGLAAIIIGIGALTAMAVPMLAFIGVLALMGSITNATENTKLLTTLMTSLTDMLIKVSLVAPLAAVGVVAMTALVTLIVAIGALAVAIGALMDNFPDLETFLTKGLSVLEQLAQGIGRVIGAFIGGIGEGLSESLVKIGEDITACMESLSTAAEAASTIKAGSFDGVKDMLMVLLEITGTSILTSIGDIFTGLFSGQSSIEKFKNDGVALFEAMEAIGKASSNVKIDKVAMDSIIDVSKRLSDLQSSLEPIGGVIEWFTGRDDLAPFGESAAAFIKSMVTAFGELEGKTLNSEGIEQIVSAATSLSELQNSLEPIGGLIEWFTGRDDLAPFGESAATFVTSMVTAFEALEGKTFDSDAIEQLVSAGASLSELQSSLTPMGGVIDWFAGRQDLATFGENIKPFVIAMGEAFGSLTGVTINKEAVAAIMESGKSLVEMTNAVPSQNGIEAWFSGSKNMTQYADDMAKLGKGLAGFAESVSGINAEHVTAAANAAKTIADMVNNVPTQNAIEAWFGGDKSVSKYADDMAELGRGLAGFAEKVTGIDTTQVSAAADAAKTIGEMISIIPNEGGIDAWFAGSKNVSKYSEEMKLLGQGLSGFATEVTGIDTAGVSAAADAAKTIGEMINIIPDEGGINSWFAGDKNVSKYSEEMANLGKGLSGFATEVTGIDTAQVSAAADAAKTIAEMVNIIPNSDGVQGWFSGEKSMAKFSTELGDLGGGIAKFAEGVAGIDTNQVSLAAGAAESLATMTNSVPSDTSNIVYFGGDLVTFGEKLVEYLTDVSAVGDDKINKVTEISTALSEFGSTVSPGQINAATDAISGLLDVMGDLGELESNADKFIATIKKLGETSIEPLLTAFKDAGPDIIKAGETAVKNFITGLTTQQGSTDKPIDEIVSDCLTKIEERIPEFTEMGHDVVEGFGLGITEWSWYAEEKIEAMATAIEAKAKKTLKINSPSKIFKEIGSGVPEGFAMGISMLSGDVNRAVTDMASTAIKSSRSTMSTILEALSADMDAQPTIRPVLDLSDVQAGANTISGLLSGTQAVGVRTNLNAISTSMNRRLQNGTDDKIIHAIDKLSSGLENNRGDTYNFAGISYSNGDEVSEAVQVLVRAAKMGRRV